MCLGTKCSDPAHPRFDLIIDQMMKRMKTFCPNQIPGLTLLGNNIQEPYMAPYRPIIANINYDQNSMPIFKKTQQKNGIR